MDHLVATLVNKATQEGDLRLIGPTQGGFPLLEGGYVLEKVLSQLTHLKNIGVSLQRVTRTQTVYEQLDVNCLVNVLHATLPTLTNIHSLRLQSNNIGYDAAKTVGVALSSCTKLLHLDLSNNQLGTMGVQALGLASFPHLRDLCLDGNQLQAPAARLLAEALPGMTRLFSLSLTDNQLGVDGIRLLAPALTSMNGLVVVRLKRNQLMAEGVQVLQGVLPLVRNLRLLDLSENQLGAGASLVARALPFMSDIGTLRLSGNDFGAHGLQALAQPLLSLTRMTSLVMCAPDSPTHVDWQVAAGMQIPNNRLEAGWIQTLQVVWDVWMRHKRSVAFAMGLHGRLGQRTHVRCLDDELLHMVLDEM